MSSKKNLPMNAPFDHSEKNDAGTSRRRLIQAMGVLGASGIVSLDWQRPVVSFGGLTAHAQSSSCSVATVEFAMTKSGTGSVSIIEERTGGASTLWSVFSFSDSFYTTAEATGSAENLTLYANATWSPGTNVTVFVAAYCCDEPLYTFSLSGAAAVGGIINGLFAFDDDGSCGAEAETFSETAEGVTGGII